MKNDKLNFFNVIDEEKEKKMIFIEKKINYLIIIKKFSNKIFFINSNKNELEKDLLISNHFNINFKNDIFKKICFFYQNYSYLIYNNYINFNILKEEFIDKNNYILCFKNFSCHIFYDENIFYVTYFKIYSNFYFVLNFLKEIIKSLKNKLKSIIIFNKNNLFLLYEKEMKVYFHKYESDKIILKTNFIYILINLKKKEETLKKEKECFTFIICNKFYFKKNKTNKIVKIKIYVKFGNNFTSYINLNYMKILSKRNNKIILNYCTRNKIYNFEFLNIKNNIESYIKTSTFK